jgi:thiamine monophosphate synthase
MPLPPTVVLLSPGNLGVSSLAEFRRQVAELSAVLKALPTAAIAATSLPNGEASRPMVASQGNSVPFCGLLLREAELEDRAYWELLLELCGMHPHLSLGVHDRAHLLALLRREAKSGQEPWLHLAGHSLPAARARALLGPEVCLGFSAHEGQAVDSAADLDYLFLSPVHGVPGKAAPLGIAGFQRARAAWSQPTWALGGLGSADLPALRAAGAAGVVFQRAWLEALSQGRLGAFLGACHDLWLAGGALSVSQRPTPSH